MTSAMPPCTAHYIHILTHTYTYIFQKCFSSQSNLIMVSETMVGHKRWHLGADGHSTIIITMKPTEYPVLRLIKAHVILLLEMSHGIFGLLHANMPKWQRRFKSSLWKNIEYIIKILMKFHQSLCHRLFNKHCFSVHFSDHLVWAMN